MTSLQSVASCAPSALAVPDGHDNDQADDAIDIAAVAGLELLDWQQDVLRASMRRRSGRWAASEVGVVVGRQNGKGSILEARQVAGLFVIGERLQIHSAHEFKTCYEHFRRVKDMIERTPVLMDEVKIIRTGAGDQAIELKNGNRIRFIARSRTSGRGFSADVVYLDEAFELSDETMGALLPALSARPDPQVWYTSSAPHKDSSVLHRVRKRGHAGDDPSLYYAEWACSPDDDPADPASWAKANPSLGLLINPERIATAQRSLDPSEFAREHMGVPEELTTDSTVIPLEQWDGLTDEASRIAGRTVVALDVSPDRKWASFAAAGRRDDGVAHVEVIERRPGTSWVIPYASERQYLRESGLRIEKGGPAASLIAPLQEAGIEVVDVPTAELTRATGQFIDAALSGELHHLGQQSLRSAVAAAQLRASGDAELWSRRSSKMDITPLVAATVALGGVPEKSEAKQPLYVGVS